MFFFADEHAKWSTNERRRRKSFVKFKLCCCRLLTSSCSCCCFFRRLVPPMRRIARWARSANIWLFSDVFIFLDGADAGNFQAHKYLRAYVHRASGGGNLIEIVCFEFAFCQLLGTRLVAANVPSHVISITCTNLEQCTHGKVHIFVKRKMDVDWVCFAKLIWSKHFSILASYKVNNELRKTLQTRTKCVSG